MSAFISLGVLFLTAIIQATLQLGQGAFLILYHASAGRHLTAKTRNLSGSFVSGVGLATFFGLSATCFLLVYLAQGVLPDFLLISIIFILMLLAIFMWFFYYRHGHTTELWLPKAAAKFVTSRARATRSNTEAFSLGVLTFILELPLSAVLLVMAANSILALPAVWQLLAILGFTLVSMIPLFVMQACFRTGRTVVDVQRWRLKNKNFLRLVSGVGFLVLAIFILAFEVIG